MDPPLNPYKGYGKINGHMEVEDQSQRHRKPALLLFLFLTVTITIGLMTMAAVVRKPQSGSSIKLACKVTRYPESCVSSISALDAEPRAGDIWKLSLRVSMEAVARVSSLLNSSGAAVGDCETLFEDALGRLNDSLALQQEALTEDKKSDAQTWISAAMTDEETCTDGLEEMGTTLPQQVNHQINRCKEFTSNTLAIIANINHLSPTSIP